MKIAYGPAGHKGVTQLMAVGADEFDEGDTDQLVKTGGMIALGVWGLGMLTGSSYAKNVGFGAAIGLWGVRLLSGKGTTTRVQVTQPAPTGRW